MCQQRPSNSRSLGQQTIQNETVLGQAKLTTARNLDSQGIGTAEQTSALNR